MDLLNIGVSRDALHTTLEIEGRSDLRQVISDELYLDDEHAEPRPVVFYPKQAKNEKQYLSNVYQCDLVFHLFLKEMWLAGNQVRALPLSTLVGVDGYESSVDEVKEGTVDCYHFVPDFHLQLTEEPRFYMNDNAELIESLLWDCMYHYNLSFVLQSITPLHRGMKPWSDRLIAYLNKRAIQYEVQGPEST